MTDPREPAEQSPDTRLAPARTRVFTDSDGIRWRVLEQPFSDYDRRSGLSLIFESEAAVRRIRNYPAEWFDLPGNELRELSWGT